MAAVDMLYRWLSRDTHPLVDDALGHALARAEPEYAARIATLLLERRRPTAWQGLVTGYDRVPAQLQERVCARPDLLHAALAAALHDRRRSGRRNGVAALRDLRDFEQAERLSAVLSDEDEGVRLAAAEALRHYADTLITGDRLATPAGRSALLRAALTAVEQFDGHRSPAVLEAALWLAKEIGAPLWAALGAPHTPAGRVVADNLPDWSSPRLAAFLLLALGQPGWEALARVRLTEWSTPAELTALVRQSELLGLPAVRRGLGQLVRPRWLLAADQCLHTLPQDVRALLPYWVCHVGFTAQERLERLARWLEEPLPEVQRAAAYTLARLDRPEAVELLTRQALRQGPMQTFARWYSAGHRLLTAHSAASPAATPSATGPGA